MYSPRGAARYQEDCTALTLSQGGCRRPTQGGQSSTGVRAGGGPLTPSPFSSRTRTFCNVRRPRRRVGKGGGGGGGGCWVLLLLRSTLLFLYH